MDKTFSKILRNASSKRRLLAATPHNVLVGNAGTFVPTYISDLIAWFDASDESTITDAGGGAVSAWNDKSGNGNNLSQGTGANRPTYNVRQLNGLETVDFDGTADFMTTAAYAGGDLTQPSTIFLVGKRDVNTADNYYYDGITSTKRHAHLVSAGNLYQTFAGAGLTGSAVATTAEYLTTIFDGASTVSYLNGVSDITGVEGSQVMDGLTVGAAYAGGFGFLDGYVAEIIVYNKALTSDEISDVETYITDKWGL